MTAGRDRTRVLKGGLLVIGILILGGVVVTFSAYRQQASPDRSDITAEKRNSTIAMEGIHHTDIRDGVKDWELEAESGDYRLEEDRAFLSMLQATFIDNDIENVFLSAESADYRYKEERAYLSILQATFLEDDGESVFLSAESGTWETDSNDLEVSGNVVLKNSQLEMKTDRLKFNEKEQEFTTDSPVAIRYLSLSLNQVAKDGISYSLETGNFTLNGKVEGKSENETGL